MERDGVESSRNYSDIEAVKCIQRERVVIRVDPSIAIRRLILVSLVA